MKCLNDILPKQFQRKHIPDFLKDEMEAINMESTRHVKEVPPWIDIVDGHTVIWNKHRICAAKLIKAQWFDSVMGCIIIANLFLIMYESDYEAQCWPEYEHNLNDCPFRGLTWVENASLAFLVVYTIEACVRLFVEHLSFFTSRWNLLDFFIVLGGWFAVIVENGFEDLAVVDVAFLRVFRILRLVRAVRIILTIREIYLLLNGLASSLRAILFGTILLFAMLLMWSIILVEWIHPINAEIEYVDCIRCADSYRSVMDSTLTLFQTVVTGDSWGVTSIPIIQKQPWTAIVLVLVVVTVSLGMMNLILAVIVERAAEARIKDLEEKTKERIQGAKHEKMELLLMCHAMDADGDHRLSLQELQDAYDNVPTFANRMSIMNIKRKDLKVMFKILDADNSGDVNYKEFINQLYALEADSTNLMFAKVQLEYKKIRGEMKSLLKVMDEHEHTLGHNSQQIVRINEKFAQLCHASGEPHKDTDLMPHDGSAIDAGNVTVTTNNVDEEHHTDEKLIIPSLSVNDVAWAAGAHGEHGSYDVSPKQLATSQSNSAEITQELVRLQLRMQDLSALRAEIGRRAEIQGEQLLHNAEMLGSTPKTSSMSQEKVGRMTEHVRLLQCQIFHQLPAAMEDLKHRVRQEAVLLNESHEMLSVLDELLPSHNTAL